MTDDPDRIPTLPRPAPLPREEAPTPIPRKSSLEELRASDEPGPAWLEAIDELRAEVRQLRTRLPELDARTSKTDLEQEAKLADHETRMQRIEKASTSAAEGTSALVASLTGKIPPKTLGALVALGTMATTVLEIWRAIHGGHGP